LINSHPEPDNDNDTTNDGSVRRFFSKNDVSCCDVENGGQWSADVVEGDADVFKTQVVECDHGHEHNWER